MCFYGHIVAILSMNHDFIGGPKFALRTNSAEL